MKQLTCLILFLYSFSAFTGDTKGHGGDILVCEDQTNTYHLRSLDYFELHEKFFLNLNVGNHLDEYDLARSAITRLQFYDFHRMNSMLSNLENFQKDIKWVNFPLVNVRDTGHVELPERCELKQIINQNKGLLRGSKKYLIRKTLWEQIKVIDKAMLIVHELLYLESKTITSQGIRELTSYIYANSLSFLSQAEYWQFLISHKFNSLSYNGFKFKINDELKLFDGKIISAIPKESSQYKFQNTDLTLYEGPVFFYGNGTPKEFCFYGKLNFNYHGQNLNAYCIHTFGYYEPIELYENGEVKSISIIKSNLSINELDFVLGDINSSNSFLSKIHLNKEGLINKIENANLSIYHNSRSIQFSSNDPFLIENNEVIGIIANRHKITSSDNTFYIHGKSNLQMGHLFETQVATPTSIKLANNILYLKQDTPISFHITGEIKAVILSENQKIKYINGSQVWMPKGSIIQFNKSGEAL